MVKRLIIVILILSSVLNIATLSYAGDPTKKLGRGLCNLVSWPLEMPLQVSRVNNSDGPMAASTYGILKGLGMMVYRAVVGVYEIVTFPFPIPKDYDPILTDPEFMFEEKSW